MNSGGRIFERGHAIIRNIEIEIAIAVKVGERERSAPQRSIQPGIPGFGESPATIIQKQPRAAADSVDQQIEVAIAVYIGQNRASGVLLRAGHAGLGSDVLELPV